MILSISACGSVTVNQGAGGVKTIKYSGASVLAYPPEAAYTTKEVMTGMKITAFKECPQGYALLKETYHPKVGSESDYLTWDIKCN